jgi:hypothetical protein
LDYLQFDDHISGSRKKVYHIGGLGFAVQNNLSSRDGAQLQRVCYLTRSAG